MSEVSRAMEAKTFKKISEAYQLLMDSNMQNMPNITGADLQILMQIYGLFPGYYRGNKQQTLHTDVMHMDGEKFLITVTESLNL
jgi:hypothetical protein